MKKKALSQQPRFVMITLSLLLMVFSMAIKSCSKSSNSGGPPPPTMSITEANSATLGSYLADGKGKALYFFTIDYNGQGNCAGGCLLEWPAFYDANLSSTTLPTDLKASDFGVITNAAGQPQNTYKGWPLYYFAPSNGSGGNTPEPAGQTGGDKFGNVWYVAKPSYSLMLANKKVVNVSTGDTTSKQYLVDSAGNTLYYFLKDQQKPDSLATNCINGCILSWPVYYTSPKDLPSSLNKADFSSITRKDGPGGADRLQATYKGRPLYYFAPDAFTRGNTKGEGVVNFWFVVNPDIAHL